MAGTSTTTFVRIINSTEINTLGTITTVFNIGQSGASAYQSYLATTTDDPKKSEIQWVESLQGEQGEQGIQGEKGDRGEQGIQGIQGEKGDKGEDAVLPTGIVIDENYVHTDNNYTDADVLEVAKIENKVDKVEGSSLVDDAEIDKLAAYPLFEHLELTSEHKDLEGKNEELSIQHVDVTVEKVLPIDADKLSIWDSIGLKNVTVKISDFITKLKSTFGALATVNTWGLLQTFTSGTKTSKIVPISNTTGVVIRNAADVADVVKFDTTNGRVGIGTNMPSTTLHVVGMRSGVNLVTLQNTGIGDAYTSIGFNNPEGSAVGGFGYATPSASVFRDKIYFYATGKAIQFSTNAGGNIAMHIENNIIGIGTTTPQSKLHVNGGIQCADDIAAASASKVGTTRYRVSGNNSYCEMCMQTGASTYAWVIIKQNTW